MNSAQFQASSTHCVNVIRHNSIEKTVAEYRLIDINAHFPLPIFPVAIFLLPKQLLLSLLDTNFALPFFPTLSFSLPNFPVAQFSVDQFPFAVFSLPLFHTLILYKLYFAKMAAQY